MKREKSMLRIESSAQFIDFISNNNAEQFVIFNGGKCKTLCTIESVNKEIEKLKNENKLLRDSLDDMYKSWETQVHKIGKAIRYLESYHNTVLGESDKEILLKILKGGE